MKYTFPKNLTLDKVRDAIRGRDEFVEANRGHYIVFNYNVTFEDSFPEVQSEADAIRRECRGLIFGPDGRVLSRRFHKFFNVNERPETASHLISQMANGNTIILEKLDGSMITPIPLKDGEFIRWGTKMGFGTDVAMKAEHFVAAKKNYIEFATACWMLDVTPIFEFVSPNNRIVVSYPEDNLVLLAIRENCTGMYWSRHQVNLAGQEYRIPVVNEFKGDVNDIKTMENLEGAIMMFGNGHMVKIKADWYVTIHKAKESLLQEKNLLKLILGNKLDDLLPHLPADDKAKVLAYKASVDECIRKTVLDCKKAVYFYESTMDRKTFAILEAHKLNPMMRSIVFKCWDNHTDHILTYITDYMLSKCGSQSGIDHLHGFMDFDRWKY